MILLFPSNLGDGALAAFAVRRFAAGEPPPPRCPQRHRVPRVCDRRARRRLVRRRRHRHGQRMGERLLAGVAHALPFERAHQPALGARRGDHRAASARLATHRSAAPVRRGGRARGVARGVAIGVFGVAGSTAMTPLLYAPLPLFLWAAARFETGGVGAALLLFGSLVIWNATAGHGPFSGAPADQNTLSLQIFLTMTAAPRSCSRRCSPSSAARSWCWPTANRGIAGVFESTSDGILVTDASHAVAAANPAFCRLTGYGAEQLRATHPRTFLHLDDLQPLDAHLGAIGPAGPVTAQVMCVCADGRLARFELLGHPLPLRRRPAAGAVGGSRRRRARAGDAPARTEGRGTDARADHAARDLEHRRVSRRS